MLWLTLKGQAQTLQSVRICKNYNRDKINEFSWNNSSNEVITHLVKVNGNVVKSWFK